MRLKHKFVFFSIVVFVCYSFSQNTLPPKLKFHSINVDDGLSNNIINTIAQDSLGFIWIGTNDGLTRYDGKNFKVFRKSFNNSNSISNNFIQSLFVDSKGHLWIMTDQGLNKFDINTELIEVYQSENSNLSHNSITSIKESTKNEYFIGTYGGGIDVLKNGVFIQNYSESSDSPISSNLISSIQIQGDSTLWAGTWYNGINKINIKNGSVKQFNYGEDDITLTGNINTLYLDKENFLWVGTNGGLSILNTVSGDFFKINNQNCPSFTDNDILSIFEDIDGDIWLGSRNSGIIKTSRKLILANKNQTVFTNYYPSINDESVNYRSISSFHQDNQGNIWIGTHHSGVNIVNPKGEKIRFYNHFSEKSETISSNSVWGICEDDKNNIWVGSDGGGLHKFNPFNNTIESYVHDSNNNKSISDNAILSACFDSQGNLWTGTYAGGISKLEPEKNTFKHYKKGLGANDLNSNDIRVIFEDRSKRIWIGTNGEGLHLYRPETDDFEFVFDVGWVDVRALTEDKYGNLWIGTFGNGIMSFDPSKKELKRYENYDELNAHIVFSLSFSSSDDLWIGTRFEGLIHLNIKTGKVFQYTEQDGLSNNTVQSVVPESPKSIWVTTNNGINLFNSEEEKFVNYSTSSNVQSGAFNNNSGFLSKNGYMVFGGINGLNVFYPEELKKDTSPLKILFTDFKIYNNSVKVSTNYKTALNKSISSLKEINLKHNEDVITIDYVALNFPSAKNINYAYKLENYDENWNKVGISTSATYRNLSPGEYSFLVKITDEERSWNTQYAKLKINISPPFWLTIPALIVYFVVAAFFTYLIVRYYTEQVKLKNSLFFEQKLRQQETDLNKERFRFFTSFSHELRTPLTLILAPVKDLIKQENNIIIQKKLTLIQRNAKILLELINKMLEFRKTETEHNHLVVGQYNFKDFLTEIYENFSFYAKEKEIEFTLDVEKEFEIWFDYRKILIVLNNLLSNAFKYTEKGGSIKILVFEREDHIILEISDSGIGIKEEEIDSIFNLYYHSENDQRIEGTGIGLALCKKLMDLHQGNITVKSALGKGTIFAIELNKTKTHYQNIANIEFKENSTYQIQKPFIKGIIEDSPADNKTELNDDDKVLLIVDDNTDVVDYVSDIMSDYYKVVSAKDGQEGINKAIEVIPDLIISDVMMPEKSGIDLCYELKNNNSTSHIPIILLTAKLGTDDKIEATKIGADDYVTKPFDSEYLVSRVNNLFKNRERIIQHFDFENPVNETKPKTVEEKFLEKLNNTIIENYTGKDISIPKLAEMLGFSRSSLYRKVKAITDTPINQYVRKVRLDEVARLITEDRLNVSEAAYQMGFNDLKYFRACFKEQFGLSASEYKKTSNRL